MTRPVVIDSRPSISSNRSQRKEVDFEAALLNPSKTLFISTSPNLDDDQPVFTKQAEAEGPDPIEKRSFEQDYNGGGVTPVKAMASPAIIPPTPSTPGSNSRRDSMASSDSAARRLSKLKPLKALGMDEEAAMEDSGSGQKRSIFRSPGTASSPDLATLVRLAKEAKGKPASPLTASKPSTSQAESRSRAASRASQPDWDGAAGGDVRSVSSGFNGGKMSTISERSRQKQGEDGFKSVRNKAKGMFGRMFGGKDHSSTAPSRMPSNSHPPVPPIPQTYAREVDERRKARTKDADVFGEVQSTATIPVQQTESPTAKAVDKPLPAIQNNDISTLQNRLVHSATDQSLSPTSTQRRTMHSRQPASDAFDNDERPPLTTPQKALASFSEDVNGMFSGIGETHLANELGLPPDSLRVKTRSKSNQSAISESTRRFPSDLGKSSKVPTPVPSRTTSLPATPSLAPLAVNRTPSSPHPGPADRPTTPVSRPSSIKSVKRSIQLEPAISDFGAPLSNTDNTYKPRRREISGSTITGSTYGGASVRLVGSPRPASIYTSPGSTTNGAEWHKSSELGAPIGDLVEVVITPGPEEDDEEKGRRLACELLDDDFSTISYEKAAIFLGGPRQINQVALRFYMQYFKMHGQNLVDSFRDLCRKLHLKAESQEIDRIIEAFSARYFECNPASVFGTAGVIHTITAAMLMLNTDLHIADLSKHMSRSDFVRNSMRAVQESMPSNSTDSTPDLVRDDSGSTDTAYESLNTTAGSVKDRRPREAAAPANRSASAPVMNQAYNMNMARNRESFAISSSFGYGKAWEQEAELALKDIYANVKAARILLPIHSLNISLTPSQKRQSVMSTSSFPDRNRGMRSPSGSRVNALKRGSIIGSQSLLGQPFGSGMSDGRLSPTPSYATSIDETVAHSFAPSFGFASNLTQTVIKEHDDEVRSMDSVMSSDTQDEMTDDQMALLGPPWAKEGMLQTRQYWESAGKKAKKQDWKQVFVVVQKGELLMFTFGGGKSGSSSGTVGGGNWTTNANSAGRLSLMHAVANGLPKPGYNNARPHCVHLTLGGGEGWFLQAGTEELVTEWVQTCNYWAARISRQPLQGGVSNMEYGWSRVHDCSAEEDDKGSIKSSKSSLSKFTGTYGRRGVPADKIHINDWRPPPPATMPSPLDEENQVEALHQYVQRLKDDLEQLQIIQEPMTKLYSPETKNLAKARENWMAKSRYMHTEIHKYETYLEALRDAIALRVKKQGENKLDRSLRRSIGSLHVGRDDNDDDADVDDGRRTPKARR